MLHFSIPSNKSFSLSSYSRRSNISIWHTILQNTLVPLIVIIMIIIIMVVVVTITIKIIFSAIKTI